MAIPRSFGDMAESKYMKKDDVGEEGLVVIVKGFRRDNLAMDGQPEEMKWVMGVTGTSLSGEPLKPVVMGPTNIQALQHATGAENPAGTIGKKIVIYCDPNVTMMGKVVGGLRIRKVTNRDVAPGDSFDDMKGGEKEALAQDLRRTPSSGEIVDDIPF